MMQGSHHQTSYVITNLKHGNKWWETSGGKPGTLTNLRHTSVPYYETKMLNTQAKGQWAACDTLPQALWHDLMMTTLFKKTTHG